MADPESALEELRTIWMVEETVAPKSYKRLRALLSDEKRAVLDDVASASPRTLLRLDQLMRDWEAHRGETPRAAHPAEELDTRDLIESLADLKRSEAEILDRAAKAAPEGAIALELAEIAEEERALAEKLESLTVG